MSRREKYEKRKIRKKKISKKLRRYFMIFMMCNLMLSVYVVKSKADAKMGIEKEVEVFSGYDVIDTFTDYLNLEQFNLENFDLENFNLRELNLDRFIEEYFKNEEMDTIEF